MVSTIYCEKSNIAGDVLEEIQKQCHFMGNLEKITVQMIANKRKETEFVGRKI